MSEATRIAVNEKQIKRNTMKNAYLEMGIPQEWGKHQYDLFHKAAAVAADLMGSASNQIQWNMFENVPCGIMKPEECTADHAIRHGVASAVGKYTKWNIDEAARFCIDILEEVNAHDAAKMLNEWLNADVES